MALPPAGWYPDTSQPGLDRWWDGSAWVDSWQRSATAIGGFKIRYTESLPNQPVKTIETAESFATLAEAQSAVTRMIMQTFGGRLPAGHSLEIFRVGTAGQEESYGRWLGKRFARIGVAAAVGTAIGFLIGQ